MSKSTILVEKTTINLLKQIGTKGQTYDAVINDLIETRRNGKAPLDSRLESLQSSESSGP